MDGLPPPQTDGPPPIPPRCSQIFTSPPCGLGNDKPAPDILPLGNGPPPPIPARHKSIISNKTPVQPEEIFVPVVVNEVVNWRAGFLESQVSNLLNDDTEEKVQPIRVADFHAYVMQQAGLDENNYDIEMKMLRNILSANRFTRLVHQPTMASMQKNRYTNVLPCNRKSFFSFSSAHCCLKASAALLRVLRVCLIIADLSFPFSPCSLFSFLPFFYFFH